LAEDKQVKSQPSKTQLIWVLQQAAAPKTRPQTHCFNFLWFYFLFFKRSWLECPTWQWTDLCWSHLSSNAISTETP